MLTVNQPVFPLSFECYKTNHESACEQQNKGSEEGVFFRWADNYDSVNDSAQQKREWVDDGNIVRVILFESTEKSFVSMFWLDLLLQLEPFGRFQFDQEIPLSLLRRIDWVSVTEISLVKESASAV